MIREWWRKDLPEKYLSAIFNGSPVIKSLLFDPSQAEAWSAICFFFAICLYLIAWTRIGNAYNITLDDLHVVDADP